VSGLGTNVPLLAVEAGRAVVSVLVLLAAAGAVGVALRRINQRARSLRRQVLSITLAALVLGAAAAGVLSWMMVLDGAQLTTVLVVLGLTALVATGLVVVASVPLGRDVARLEATVRRIEQGERAVRTDVHRSDELGHVARALDELAGRLATLEQARAGFEAERTAMLSSVSHDLRTPIAALRAAIEALADGIAPDPGRYLRSMQRDVEALTALVDDLFLLTRLENGSVELLLGTVDLTEIADEAIEALAPVAAAHDVKVVLATPGRVRANGNAGALARVIRNLLDNALRHAPPGSQVTVDVGHGSPGAGEAAGSAPTVSVIDHGPGFPAPFAARAFDRFTRADASRNRSTGGAGLGLAIARSVIEAHGGRIWIEAAAGGHVAFELPAA
jgi:signal transduction histidine kinase